MAHAQVRQFAPPPFRPETPREEVRKTVAKPQVDLPQPAESELPRPARFAIIFFLGLAAWAACGLLAWWLFSAL